MSVHIPQYSNLNNCECDNPISTDEITNELIEILKSLEIKMKIMQDNIQSLENKIVKTDDTIETLQSALQEYE